MSHEALSRLPEPPDWLGEEGQKKWGDLGKKLVDRGSLMPEHLELLEQYCDAFQDFRDATKVIEDQGTTAISDGGSVYQHPEVGRRNRAKVLMHNIAKLLKLNVIDLDKPKKTNGVPTRQR